MVLTNNYFDFNGKHYHQKSGTARGTKLAPSYANLFMSKFEQAHVYTYHLQPTLWKRFIDDIFLIGPHGMDSLTEFIQYFLKRSLPYSQFLRLKRIHSGVTLLATIINPPLLVFYLEGIPP